MVFAVWREYDGKHLIRLLNASPNKHSLIFFFQAEDGIRAATVTGVQTCALPICMVGGRKVALVEPPICAHCGSVMQLRARHVQFARLVPDRHADMAVLVSCPHCHTEGAQLMANEATHMLRQGLTYLNLKRGGRRRAEDAAREVDQIGGPDRLVRDIARRELMLRNLRPERGLALEMAVDERAEVEELERQWKEAEELADIADGTLGTATEVENELRRLKNRDGNQPSG